MRLQKAAGIKDFYVGQIVWHAVYGKTARVHEITDTHIWVKHGDDLEGLDLKTCPPCGTKKKMYYQIPTLDFLWVFK